MAALTAGEVVMLTTSVMNAHDALTASAGSSIAGFQPSMAACAVLDKVGVSSQNRETEDDASSILSSVPSSDLSDLDSEEDTLRRPLKRRRKNMLTPPTSVDEPTSKRVYGRKAIREGPSEYDVEDRKEFFEAGLYSGATNTMNNNGRVKMQRRSAAKGTGRLLRPIEEIVKDFKLGLPLFHGLKLLEEKREFRLPWDIRNDFDLSCLPESAEGLKFRSDAWDRVGRQKKPAPYKQISQSA